MRLWSTGVEDLFDEYVDELVALLPRSNGSLVRQIRDVASEVGRPDAVLVMAFPERVNVDSFLRDPAREDLDDLAASAVVRSLITDGRRRDSSPPAGSLHALPGAADFSA